MPHIRLVKHVCFHDDEDLLLTGGIRGVHVFRFRYRGKYNPKLGAQVDPKGRYIDIDLIQ